MLPLLLAALAGLLFPPMTLPASALGPARPPIVCAVTATSTDAGGHPQTVVAFLSIPYLTGAGSGQVSRGRAVAPRR